MRIAHVSLDGNLPRYGVGTAVVRLTGALARRGHDVLLLARRPNAEACPAVPGVRALPLDHRGGIFGGRPAYLRQLRRAVRPGVDVVHVHGLTRMAAWLLPARARAGVRLVVTAHSLEELGPAASASGRAPPRRARRHAAQVRRVLEHADEILVPSDFFAEQVLRRCARRPRVVPWGPTDDTPAARTPHADFRVLVLGRLVREKGVHVLLEAFARGLGRDGGARLVVAGDGPERGALVRQAQDLGIGSQVAFVGYADGAARRALLAEADVVAVPSLGEYETFCLSALDGAAAGAALLVADGGALPERAAGCGRVVPAGDLARWAAALRGLRDDPRGTRALGDEGRLRAADLTWDATARRHERVYSGEGPAGA